MGKSKIKTITHNGIEFPSQTEAVMYCWCKEAKALGLIESFEMQKEYEIYPTVRYTVEKPLKTKIKHVERVLLNRWTYTSDFEIVALRSLNGLIDRGTWYRIQGNWNYTCDAKGDRINPNQASAFSHKQKGLYHMRGVYVNKCQPSTFYPANGFPLTVPEACFKKTGSGLYKYWQDIKNKCPTIEEAYNL